MASFERRPTQSGKYHYLARVRVEGFPERSATFTKAMDAKAWAASLEADYRMGRYHAVPSSHKLLMSDIIDRYIDNVLFVKSSKQRYVDQQHGQLLWWRFELGDYQYIHITPHVLAGCRDDLLKSGKKPGTVNRYMAALNHVFTTAIREWGCMDENPLAKVSRPKEPRGRVRFLSEKERETLLLYVRKCLKKPLYLIVLLALYTGARKAELLNACIEDVDLRRGMIVINETKNHERRTLFVSGNILHLLKEHIARLRMKTGLLFSSRNGKPMNVDKEFRKAVNAARIKDFRFHDLRHTFASYMAMNGASLAEIAEALGHKTLNMVKRYAHLCKGHMAKVVEDMVTTMMGEGRG